MNIKEKLENLPTRTGVYKFLDKNGVIMYVGKALNLRSRVSSYFRDTHADRPHIIPMIPLIEDIDYVITDNEVESLILESALVKKYNPKFNVELKDDKSFAWIYITTRDEFPTVKIVRSIKKEEYFKGRLFGPYPDGRPVKRIFDYLRKMYPFCTCNEPRDLCLYYHLGLCPGPYHGKISKEDYRENIDNIIKFLQGKKRNIIIELKRKMEEYSKDQDYEKAANFRDKIADLEYLAQKIEISPFESETEYLKSKQEKNIEFLKNLSAMLRINRIRRMECYDISNIQGKFSYGSMTVAIDGRVSTDDYRIFKINELTEPNDPAMLAHVLKRRFRHLGREDDKSLSQKPDLILIDGGKSQLGVVKDNIPDGIAILGISKGKRLKRAGKKQKDEFWYLTNGEAVQIKLKDPFILINLRDEAHRFGIKHHRKNRALYSQKSLLDKIDGVGDKRRRDLIKTFHTIENIKNASVEDLNKVVKSMSVAENIKKVLNS